MSNQYLSFDVTKQSTPQQLITGRQGDSQLKFVSVLLWDGEKNLPYDLTGKQIAFEALKPDGTHIVDHEGITILDAPHGLFRYSFNEQVFAVAGTMKQAFFKITHTDNDDQVIADSTLEINIHVLENRVEFGINSTDYLSEYDDLIAQVKQKFDDYAATVQDSIDKANALHDQIVEYANLINAKGVVLVETFGDVKGIKQPSGANFVEKLNNEFYDRGINPRWYHTGNVSAEQAISQAINVAVTKGQPVIFTEDYVIGALSISDNVLIIGNGHTLISDGNSGKSLITTAIKDKATVAPTITINNLSIINKGGYKTGISNIGANISLQNVTTKDFIEKGMHFKKTNINSDVYLKDIGCFETPIGIDLATTDVKLDGYRGRNCKIHINNASGNDFLTNIHGWNWKDQTVNWVDGSCLITFSGSCIVTNVFADTVETAFMLPASDYQYHLISIKNAIYFLNKDAHPTKAPKLFANLDKYSSKLHISGVEVDANAWTDENGEPEIINANIFKDRVKIDGLLNNGFKDSHFVNKYYTQNPDFYHVSANATIKISTGKLTIQQGDGSVLFDGGLTRQVVPGENMGEIILNDDIAKNIFSFNESGNMFNVDGKILPLGVAYNSQTRSIRVYNASSDVYTGSWSLHMIFTSYQY